MNRTREFVAAGAAKKSTAGGTESILSTDSELLMRFVRHRDHGAFAEIVARHGGLVWIVCREVLRHHQDIEDAFQATFFILAERAGSIRSSESAAAWLFKVAQRTSLAARRKRSRRREEELAVDPLVGDEALFLLPERETLYVLLQELGGLPDQYRTPLVLRYLEGQSRRAIAEQTDSTVAQIQGRLVRGRRMLRSRMLRRGVSLSIAAGSLAGATATAKAAVTPAVAATTAKSCLELKTTGAAVGATSAAIQLAKQGAKAMWLASMMKTTAVVSAAFAAAGIAWAVEAGGGQGNKHAAASDASVVELRTAAGADKQVVIADASKGSSADSSQSQPPSGIGTITVTGGPSRPLPPGLSVGRTGLADALVAQRNIVDVLGIATQAAESTADREKKCDDQLTELRKRVATNQKEKLDYIQLLAKQKTEESLIQRELDRTHESLVMLRLSPPDNGASDDARKKHAGQVDKLQTLVEEVKERMATASRNSALTSAQVEQVDLELSELSKMKSEVARMKLQMEFAPPQAATGPRSDLRTQLRGVIIDTTGVPPTEQKVEEVIGRIIDSAPERVNTVDVARSADTPKGAAGAVWQAKSGDGVTNTATLTIDPSVDQGTISISTASPEQTSRLEKERSAWRQKALTYRLNADHAEAMALEIDQQLKVLAKPKPQSHVDRAAVQRLQDENEILKKQLDDMKARIRDANKAK